MSGEDMVRYAILIGFVAATLSAPICAAQTITVGSAEQIDDTQQDGPAVIPNTRYTRIY
jgi:hypothetical protein